jgi:hypothetical protein
MDSKTVVVCAKKWGKGFVDLLDADSVDLVVEEGDDCERGHRGIAVGGVDQTRFSFLNRRLYSLCLDKYMTRIALLSCADVDIRSAPPGGTVYLLTGRYIAKPRYGSGSQGLVVFSGDHFVNSTELPYVVETYITGPKCRLDVAISRGEPYLLGCFDRISDGTDPARIVSLSTRRELDSAMVAKAREIAAELVVIGLDDLVFGIEFHQTGEEYLVKRLNGRIGASCLPLYGPCYGCDILKLLSSVVNQRFDPGDHDLAGDRLQLRRHGRVWYSEPSKNESKRLFLFENSHVRHWYEISKEQLL